MAQVLDNYKIPEWLSREEAIFLLGKLRLVVCTDCRDFYHGCRAGASKTVALQMSIDEWIYKSRKIL